MRPLAAFNGGQDEAKHENREGDAKCQVPCVGLSAAPFYPPGSGFRV